MLCTGMEMEIALQSTDLPGNGEQGGRASQINPRDERENSCRSWDPMGAARGAMQTAAN